MGRCLVSPRAGYTASAVRSGLLARAMSSGHTTVYSQPKGGTSLLSLIASTAACLQAAGAFPRLFPSVCTCGDGFL